jgi:hypothetical protein
MERRAATSKATHLLSVAPVPGWSMPVGVKTHEMFPPLDSRSGPGVVRPILAWDKPAQRMPRMPRCPIGSRVPTEQRRSRPTDSLHSEARVHRRTPFRRVYLLLARGEHGRQLERSNADAVRHPGGAYSRTAWSGILRCSLAGSGIEHPQRAPRMASGATYTE